MLVDEVFLDEQWAHNDSMEILKIVSILNGKKYGDYLELSFEMRRLIDEFDPFNKEKVTDIIFKKLRPEHKELFSPVNILKHRRRRWWSGCFSRT
jgi:hypothetical protein